MVDIVNMPMKCPSSRWSSASWRNGSSLDTTGARPSSRELMSPTRAIVQEMRSPGRNVVVSRSRPGRTKVSTASRQDGIGIAYVYIFT